MNQSFHELVQLILRGITWLLRTVEALWIWSWSQIFAAFSISWADLPGWKVAFALIVILVLATLLVVLFKRGLQAFGEIAAAFWTMAVTLFGILAFIVVAALLSRGLQWVVASVPNDFWSKFL